MTGSIPDTATNNAEQICLAFSTRVDTRAHRFRRRRYSVHQYYSTGTTAVSGPAKHQNIRFAPMCTIRVWIYRPDPSILQTRMCRQGYRVTTRLQQQAKRDELAEAYIVGKLDNVYFYYQQELRWSTRATGFVRSSCLYGRLGID